MFKKGTIPWNKVDLIIQNRQEFKVPLAIGLNRLFSCTLLLWYIGIFTGIFLISSWRFLRISGNDR